MTEDCHGWGRTTWCMVDRHDRCEHRIGGRLERGVWTPECYVLMTNPSGKGRFSPPGRPMVVRPSHVYRCTCDCHTTGQYALFETEVS